MANEESLNVMEVSGEENEIAANAALTNTEVNVPEQEPKVPEQEPEQTPAETIAEESAPDAEEDTAVDGTDYAEQSESELVSTLATLLAERPVHLLRRDVEAVKVAFYRRHHAAVEAARKAFVDAGGDAADFVATEDAEELRLKDLLREYRLRRDQYMSGLEAVKEDNYKAKLAVIEELKELAASDETVNTTFARFRELQQRWKDIGPVPQQYVKDLWETYNVHVENFYNFIKINKELRDLDLKKNQERKTALCEAAEALVTESSAVEAFHKLQKLHEEWRETGPVANECKETLWLRFKEASTRINKRHQEFFDSLKAEQTQNLALKSELCDKAEALVEQPYTTATEWNKAGEELLELQRVWKTIGFAPKKDNNKIYERFRAACDKFFDAKRSFYAGVKDEMEHNLQLKTELCEAVEALQNSDDWKKATEEILALQKRWKEIGQVSRRHSDRIWKRFRAACDTFFERKSQHFAGVENEYAENLRRKIALLEEMKNADAAQGGYEVIRSFQRRWSEIGFVPIKNKEELQRQYKETVDKLFGALRGAEHENSVTRWKEKVSSMKQGGDKRLRSERERLYNRVRQLEADIATLENNIGFFSKSKNAEALAAGVREKIERAKREVQQTVEKINLIDREQE